MITHHWIVEITYVTSVITRDNETYYFNDNEPELKETYYFNGSEAELKEIIDNIEKVTLCYVEYYRVSEVHNCKELRKKRRIKHDII